MSPSEIIARFTYYPGSPTGYSAFTDHHAMRCDLNDWLLKESDEKQYWLAGFGDGFVETVLAQFGEDFRDAKKQELTVRAPDMNVVRSIDWLNRLQVSGTDNSRPSTSNLHSALVGSCLRIAEKGPVRSRYWDNSGSESAERSTALPADVAESISRKIEEARNVGLSLKFRP